MGKLRSLVDKALRKSNELSFALQDIGRHMTFIGFDGEEPEVSICSGEEIILYYRGKMLDINAAIDYMESKGYVSYDDLHY